jgi:hypothetical protein
MKYFYFLAVKSILSNFYLPIFILVQVGSFSISAIDFLTGNLLRKLWLVKNRC